MKINEIYDSESSGFLSRGDGGSIHPPWLWFAPLEILFHMSRGKVLMLWIEK